jgi:hypothetical protein
MLMLNKTPAAAMSSVIALLPEGANRAPVRFRMTSSNQENGFVGLARQRAMGLFCYATRERLRFPDHPFAFFLARMGRRVTAFNLP